MSSFFSSSPPPISRAGFRNSHAVLFPMENRSSAPLASSESDQLGLAVPFEARKIHLQQCHIQQPFAEMKWCTQCKQFRSCTQSEEGKEMAVSKEIHFASLPPTGVVITEDLVYQL